MSQGVVTDYLIGLIRRQVDDHAIVVCFDPERAYEEAFQELQERTKERAGNNFPVSRWSFSSPIRRVLG
jgi:hypothetical protein